MTQSTVYVYTIPSVGGAGYWSYYTFPFPVDDFTVQDDVLYIRSGNDVLYLDQASTTDFHGDTQTPSREAAISGAVQTPWLDLGSPGVNKMLTGFDFVSNGPAPKVSFGYDQSHPCYWTPPFEIPPDTVPGMVIPMPLCGPSLSVRVTYEAAPWNIQAMNLYLQDERATS